MTKLDIAPPVAAEPEPTRRDPLIVVLFVAGVVFVGIVLRFLTKSDMWLDEALAVNIAHLPVRQIGPWLRHDGAPPLYYLILHYWMKVFGTGDLGARSLSGVFSVAAMPLAWLCGRRFGGRRLAWITLLVFCANTYAVLYATSARMYSMEIFLVFAGTLAVSRAFEKPSLGRLAVVAALVAILIYTQYWGFYLVAAVALLMLGAIVRVPENRDAAVRILIAMAVGLLTFTPWVPTFLYQAKHTGTPWGKPVFPPTPVGLTFQDFSGGQQQEGWILLLGFIVLVFLGTFAVGLNDRHIDVDVQGQPRIRWAAVVGAAALVIGATAAWASRNAFQSRYASIVFPFFVLLVARGVTCFTDKRWRAALLVAIVALGFIGGARNVTSNRTSAAKVAAILKREAKPGDVVLYCPDQVGPAVHRLVAGRGLDEVTYPRLLRPALIDWVDYKAVLARHKPAVVAQQVLARAGAHNIWYVSAPGYTTHAHTCDALSDALTAARPMELRLASDPNSPEKQGLKEFPAR